MSEETVNIDPEVIEESPKDTEVATAEETVSLVSTEPSDAQTATEPQVTEEEVVSTTSLTDHHKEHGSRILAALKELIKVIEEGGVTAEQFIGEEYKAAKEWLDGAVSFIEKKL